MRKMLQELVKKHQTIFIGVGLCRSNRVVTDTILACLYFYILYENTKKKFKLVHMLSAVTEFTDRCF